MAEIPVRTPGGSYHIYVGRGVYERELAEAMRKIAPSRAAIVSNPPIFELYGRRLREILVGLWPGAGDPLAFLFPAGEENKNLHVLEEGYQAFVDGGIGRGDIVLAFGGGVVGDLAGLLAATYMRGMGLVHMPTTLMAMVDSSIGGKVGVDLPHAKNAVGAFHQPLAVFSDISVLETLPQRELSCGFAEVAKYGFLFDRGLLRMMKKTPKAALREDESLIDLIACCARHKARIVAADERDLSGERALLNYGHTFGHALESSSGYKCLRHGEAIALGMMMAARASELAGLAQVELIAEHRDVLQPLLKFAAIPEDVHEDGVFQHMQADKKKGRDLRFVLLEEPQKPRLVESLPEGVVKRAVREVLDEARRNG